MESVREKNQEVFEDIVVCDSYVSDAMLQLPEEAILNMLRSHIRQGDRILDLGVGAGRTTRALMNLSSNYTGVDYSSGMISRAKNIFPGVDFRVGDVRDLSAFAEDEFTLIFFSFNGIDYIDHNDRMKAFAEIKRVMKTGGHFVFSSHNLNYSRFDSFKVPYEGRILSYFKRLVLSAYNRLRHKRRHVYEKEYAIVTDPGHFYNLLTYYISAEQQQKQLHTAGFMAPASIFDKTGNNIDSNESAWLYYLVRKN